MNIDFNRRLSIAPMLDCTDRHERYFLRLLSKHILLYSEMVVSTGLLHCENKDLFLGHEPFEHPAVLQLGGSNPADLAAASKLVEAAGFSEVNLNCGCPSDRVQNGNFGACLMKEKNVVADCFKAMQDAVSIPVSIKCRIGVDDLDSWEFFTDFIQTVRDAGCKIFIVHARKAWLKGLSPKENREVPPLHYEFVHRLKAEMPELNLSINGGIKTLDQVEERLKDLDGVMVGREAYEKPTRTRGSCTMPMNASLTMCVPKAATRQKSSPARLAPQRVKHSSKHTSPTSKSRPPKAAPQQFS